MPEIYDPEMEDEDQGYSIPKILVAVLLLILIGAGTYIFLQQRKIADTVRLLTEQKEQVDKELAEMIEMYNLAKDDNNNLSKELFDERDKIIHFRDSVRKLKFVDQKSIDEYDKALKKLKENSKLEFDAVPTQRTNTAVNNTVTTPVENSTVASTNTTTVANTPAENNTSKEASPKTTEDTKPATINTPNNPEILVRSEIPATYPGCSGTNAQKTECFKKKVSGFLASKFQQGVVENLNLSSGSHRISVGFTVDKFGNVTNINAKGPNARAEQEAVKAAKALPKMIPARQNGVPVDVNFVVPLTVKVE